MIVMYNGNGTITVHTPRCIVCNKTGEVVVPEAEWEAYQSPARPFIQDALKSVDSAGREQIMTGTHGPCWDSMFAEEER